MLHNFSTEAEAALIGALIGALVQVIIGLCTYIVRRKEQSFTRKDQIQSAYLNPLRMIIYDTSRRLNQIIESPAFLFNLQRIRTADELFFKNMSWFYEEGHYLCSTLYLYSCLIARIHFVRNRLPALHLTRKNYKRISNALLNCEFLFRRITKIWAVIQLDISADMQSGEGGEMIPFRQFCEKLQDRDKIYPYLNMVAYFTKKPENSENMIRELQELNRRLVDLYQMLSGMVGLNDRILRRKTDTEIE